MTITSTARLVSYNGTGTTGPFPYPFKIFAAGDLQVTHISVTGTETVLVLGTDYTVTGAGNRTGGNVLLTTALAIGETLVIERIVSLTQTTPFRTQGKFSASSHEDAFDKVTMGLQQHQDQLGRTLQLSLAASTAGIDTTLPLPDAAATLTWADNGLSLQNKILDTSGAIAVPGFGRTVPTATDYLGNNQVFDPRDWLAAANGGADDGAKIQSAHDAAVANNGEAILSRGIYRATGVRALTGGLTIRRGAKLKPAAGAVLTLGAHNGGPYPQFDMSEAGAESGAVKFYQLGFTCVIVDWFGAGAGKTAAENIAGVRAAYASLPAGGGRLQFLDGVYDFGRPTNVAALPSEVAIGLLGPPVVLRILTAGTRIAGMGRNRTTLQFDSTGGNAFASNKAGAIFAYNISANGLPPLPGGLDGCAIEGLAFRDVATSDDFSVAWGGAVSGIMCKNYQARDILLINGKGNGPFTVLGDAPNNTTPGSGDLVMEEFWVLGENRAAGLHSSGDWINVSAFGRIHIRGFHQPPSGGCNRHALEFGTGIGELYVEDSVIDMNNQGFACLASFTIITKGHFKNVECLGWSHSAAAIPINPDAPTQPVNNLQIIGCRFITSTSGLGAVNFDAGMLNSIEVYGNYFDSQVHIGLNVWPTGYCKLGPNTHSFLLNGGGTAIINTGSNPKPPDATCILDVGGSTIVGVAGGGFTAHLIDFTQWPAANTVQLRGMHRTTLVKPVTGQPEGRTLVSQVVNPAVANGALSPIYEVVIPGVFPGDKITITPRADGNGSPPTGVKCWGDAVVGVGNVFAFASAVGGTLATGRYYYVVTAIDAYGESVASDEVFVDVVGPTGSVGFSWVGYPGATDYRVYRGTTHLGQDHYQAVGGAIAGFTDAGAAGTAATPPKGKVRWYFQNNSGAAVGGVGVSINLAFYAERN